MTDAQLATLIFAAPFLLLATLFFVGSHFANRAPALVKIRRK